MNIAAMRKRITIQKNSTEIDKYGNHKPAWIDYFTCWATIAKQSNSTDETHESGYTQEHERLGITVRWSSETAAVNSKEYRITLDDRLYDIVDIDEMNYKHNSRKFICVLCER